MLNQVRRWGRKFLSCESVGRGALLPLLLFILPIMILAIMLALPSGNAQNTVIPATTPTFYRDVLPIFEQHCQRCHRAGEIGPMPLVTADEARRSAGEIREKVRARQMPPWFADPAFGKFSDDPSLTEREIATLSAWADAHAPVGDPHDAPPPRHWTRGWNIPKPALVLSMPKPVSIPAHGDVEYTYEIVPTGFSQDRWVEMAEVRPSSRQHVHHAVVYIRPPNSQ